ncbi:MAG: hypothetical protein ABSA33_04515 [Candidatus Micrarchaeaceae archaeon]
MAEEVPRALEEKERAVHAQMDRFRGRMCGLVESFGLKDIQTSGMKATLKSLSYDNEKAIIDLIRG